MKEVYIVDAIRTPIGRYKGQLSSIRPDTLASYAIQGIVERNPQIEPWKIEDVYLGCANQAGEDNRNIARMAVLLAGLPESVPGCTVNRLCASGLEAVNMATAAMKMGCGDIMIAGGVESMSRAPLVMLKPETGLARGNQQLVDTTLGWRFINPDMYARHACLSMGETAEKVAKRYGITRRKQDEYAFLSQQRTRLAQQKGRFQNELYPILGDDKNKIAVDEHPRPKTTLPGLSALSPIFSKEGTITAGNSSGINDGASALLLMTEDAIKQYDLRPLAKIVSFATVGVDPDVMGIGPVYAAQKLLKRAGLTQQDIHVIEINEAFAAQVLACAHLMQVDIEKVNVNGGAIALGHPLGASGARILTTLMYELLRKEGRYGLATMCVGVGQGVATLIERCV